MTDFEYMTLKRIINRLTGIELDSYKQEQMRRRLDSFVQHRAYASNAIFCRELDRDPVLLQALTNMLTINVTEFFRDRSVFDQLRHVVLPELLSEKPSLRIWSAGCSRGCEAYTLAILLDELDTRNTHSILATDVDENALAVALQAGPYPTSEIKSVPSDYLGRYFRADGGTYHFTNQVRQRIQFRVQNLLADTFETGFDLIACRNVMIYFTPEARRVVTQKFLDSLRPGGLLLLGSTEALMPADSQGFENAGASLYRKSSTLERVQTPGMRFLEKRGA